MVLSTTASERNGQKWFSKCFSWSLWYSSCKYMWAKKNRHTFFFIVRLTRALEHLGTWAGHSGTRALPELGQSGTPALGHLGTQALGHSSTQALGHSGTQALGHSGTQALWHSGTQALMHSGTQALRHPGTQALRHSGTKLRHSGN